ncbi:hypothetical protein KJS94_14455 [Flavihumibacter rivuli]|uniref:hypothetical protein n=1 Tax=Flavihumibacter rivuli TaxID=2838156 RepID=UPI001BDEA65B|nr:hypothetical protein [Flavihumibacter rivuli]ULQ55848.1 hypothetical protein KJS94_14455 [Flavihumibacter rivuli]
MKLKVLAYTLSVPLIWMTLLFFKDIVPDYGLSNSFSSAVLCGLIVGSIIGRFLLDRKYLTELFFDDENVTFTYLTPLTRQHQVTFRISTLIDIKLKKRIFLIRDFYLIKVFSEDTTITFCLFNPDTKQAAEQLALTFLSKSVVTNK